MIVDARQVSPFTESVEELFSTMLGLPVTQEAIEEMDAIRITGEVVALVGLTGARCGTVAICFPTATALSIASRFIGMELTEIDETVSDALAELANIVGGGAKARLSGAEEEPTHLTLPTVVSGSSFQLNYPPGSVLLRIAFGSELGAFALMLIFTPNGKEFVS